MPSEVEFLHEMAAAMVRISRESLDIRAARELRNLADIVIERANIIGKE